MGAYFLKINPLSAASLQSLHRRLIISSFHQFGVSRQSIVKGDVPNAQAATLSTSTHRPSTQWELHLSVASKHGNPTLSTSSHELKDPTTQILLPDSRTCSSCGYISPHPNGRYMVVDHIDGDASNNDLSNLRTICPPCNAIRHCGLASLENWITVRESTMEQVEIVRKTRGIFEDTGVIPDPNRIDPSVKPVDISAVRLANVMQKTLWKDLPEEFQRLRGFFKKHGLASLQNWITFRESTMEQVEIVRKTRGIFEDTGVIPDPNHIDPSVKPVEISAVRLANVMQKMPWKDLPEEFQRLRGFFKKHSSQLFRDTLLSGDSDTRKVPNDDSTANEALCNYSDRRAAEIAAHEKIYPWIRYSEKLHESSQVFLDLWPPSKTLKTQVPWICVDNRRSADKSPGLDTISLSFAWKEICAKLGGQPTLSAVDKLAEDFNVLTGKWLVFVTSDKVDNLWGQIVKSTLAGTLGISAKVSTRDENDRAYRHVICVYNADYRSMAEVNRVRDELTRLGVKQRIAYKPDIYTYCGIYKGNSWGIPASRYYF